MFDCSFCRSDDSGETCCYNAKGELLDIRESPGSGTHQRYHYKAQGDSVVPFFSFFVSDLLPKLHCCQYSSKNCSDFVKHRNATSCQGYTPPSPGNLLILSSILLIWNSEIHLVFFVYKNTSLHEINFICNPQTPHIFID